MFGWRRRRKEKRAAALSEDAFQILDDLLEFALLAAILSDD